jgi:hypothetical protein
MESRAQTCRNCSQYADADIEQERIMIIHYDWTVMIHITSHRDRWKWPQGFVTYITIIMSLTRTEMALPTSNYSIIKFFDRTRLQLFFSGPLLERSWLRRILSSKSCQLLMHFCANILVGVSTLSLQLSTRTTTVIMCTTHSLFWQLFLCGSLSYPTVIHSCISKMWFLSCL